MMIELIQPIASFKALIFYVILIHKDDPTLIADAPVTIIQSIDGGIELIMTSQSLHH